MRTFYQITSAGRGVEVNVAEAVQKTSVKFEYDLSSDHRPSIFRHYFLSDADNFLFFKLIQKQRRNRVDTNHCSRLLMERALSSDTLYSAKLGAKTNYFFRPQRQVESVLTLNASTEIASNFSDSTFHRSKFFARLV